MEAQLGIFTTDLNLVVGAWDLWLETVTARSAAEVCGQALTHVFPELEARGLISHFRRVLEQGAVELLAPAFHGYLFACPPRNPSQRFQHMQQRTVIAPLREGGDIVGLVVTVEDVTLRREREMELDAALSDGNWRQRRLAIDELVRDGERASVAEFTRRIREQHRDPSLLNSILQLLVSGAWEALEPLLELAKDEDPEVRMYAALGLGELRDRRAAPGLVELLQDSDTNVKYHAIEALARLKAPEAVDELTRIAEGGEFFLAFPALDALSAIGDSRTAARLAPLLENDMLRGAAAAALAALGDESIVPPIVALMEHRALIPVIADALASLHRRYENLYGEGEHIVDLVRRHAPAAAAQNILDSLNTATGDTLRSMVRVIGWLKDQAGNAEVIVQLTQLLGSAAVRKEVIETLVRYGEHVLEPLSQQLESDDFETRRAAVAALSRIGDRRSVPALLGVLSDPELTVEAAGALARIGDARAYEPLLQLLSHDRAPVRQVAVAAINSLGHPRTAADVRRLLQDPNPHVRECAFRIAGYFGYAECAAQLMEGVRDSNENVRRAAVENLPHLRDERVLPILLKAARDDSARIRSAAVQSLGFLETAESVPELLRALADKDAWVRYYAARALAQLGSPEAIEPLASVLRTDQANHVRIAAAEALGAIGGRRVVSILAPQVDSDDADLARASLMALGAVGHPDALQPILSILRSESPNRLAAVHAVGARRDQEAVDALQWTAGVDADPAVCEAAIHELAKIATPESISALIRLTADRRLRELAVAGLGRLNSIHIDRIAAGLRSAQTEVRRSVIDALGRMKHPAASEVLSRALDDGQPDVRLAAILALRRLGSHTSEKKLAILAHSDPDPNVRKAAEQALARSS